MFRIVDVFSDFVFIAFFPIPYLHTICQRLAQKVGTSRVCHGIVAELHEFQQGGRGRHWKMPLNFGKPVLKPRCLFAGICCQIIWLELGTFSLDI